MINQIKDFLVSVLILAFTTILNISISIIIANTTMFYLIDAGVNHGVALTFAIVSAVFVYIYISIAHWFQEKLYGGK